MKEVREAGGPWTVAGDPQEGGKMGLLVVKCGVGGGGGYKYKCTDGRTAMKERWR